MHLLVPGLAACSSLRCMEILTLAHLMEAIHSRALARAVQVMTSMYLIVSGRLAMERDCENINGSSSAVDTAKTSNRKDRYMPSATRRDGKETCVEVYQVGPGSIVGAASVDNLSPYA